jgi:hypothetical protein
MNRNPKHGTTQFLFLALFCSLLLSFTPSSSVRGQGADRASAASPDKLGPGRFIPPEGKPEAVNIEAPAAAPAGCQLFDFESGDGGFTVEPVFGAPALWHLADVCRAELAGHSATHTFYYGDDSGCNYNTGARNAANLISPNISLVGATTISFNYLLFVEGGGFDTASVDYSTNNGTTWTQFLTKANMINDNQWHNISVDMSAILANANTVRLRFRFDTVDNIANSTTGWHIDDVQVCGAAPLRPWTTEGSVGTIDTASTATAVLNDFGFTLATSAVPGASKGGTAIARYNITAVDGVSNFCPATQSNVLVRFRNQDNSGATSRVSFTINARSMATGAKSTIFTFSSNGNSVPGQQSTLATFTPAIDFDFPRNTYWIEATVFASKPQQPNLSPALQSVQIWESAGTPCQ